MKNYLPSKKRIMPTESFDLTSPLLPIEMITSRISGPKVGKAYAKITQHIGEELDKIREENGRAYNRTIQRISRRRLI